MRSLRPAAFSLKCDCIFVCGGFMRRLEVDRLSGRTRLLQWQQELQGAHCRSLRALRQFWCRHRACRRRCVLFGIASLSVPHGEKVRRSHSFSFLFFSFLFFSFLFFSFLFFSFLFLWRTTAAHLTSVRTVTTYKKKAIDLRSLERTLSTTETYLEIAQENDPHPRRWFMDT